VLAAAPNLTRDGVLRRHGTIRTTLSSDPKCRPATARTLSAALLADKYGVPLPAARIAQLIDGRDAVRAHGTADMPVWGEKLYAMGEGERGELGIGEVIGKIVAYLNTIQNHRRAMALSQETTLATEVRIFRSLHRVVCERS
jgi:hypothetical protein